jgi:nitrogen fixation protein FixH
MAPSSTARTPTTMTELARNAQPQRKSLWIPALFVGLMLLVVAVNGTMMYFAESTFSGLDTDKAYQEGLEYNATLKEAAANAALGWTATTRFNRTVGGWHVAVTITDRGGVPVAGLQMTAHLVRPVSTAFDQLLTLRPEASGIYGADVTLPASGSWELRLSADDGQGNWQTVQRVFVK